MKKTLLLLVLLCSPVFAMKEYYSISKSIRALGMGGAFYGLSDDEYALFYNPAGLAEYRGKWELGLLNVNADIGSALPSALSTITGIKGGGSVSDIVSKLQQFQGVPLYGNAGVALPFFHMKNFAIGLLLADAKLDMAVLGANLSMSLDVTAISDTGLVVGYGRHILDNLAVGMNAKYHLLRAGGH